MSPRRTSLTRLVLGLAAALLASACSPSAPGGAPGPRPEGPPHVRAEVVARHARQFDDELARRPAGSQQEEAAAVYILGHLQRAGYSVRLEAVPVADTVTSTDVIALPPDGGEPDAVVAVPYDTGEGAAANGDSLGLFLELARALAVAEREHAVELVALGAEHSAVGGSHLGSRRLVRLLVDAGHRPVVLTIDAVEGGARAGFGAFGSAGSDVAAVAERLGVPALSADPSIDRGARPPGTPLRGRGARACRRGRRCGGGRTRPARLSHLLNRAVA
jgi:hypothetical protein